MIFNCTIYGDAIPQQRPRFSKKGHVYNPQRNEKQEIQYGIKQQCINKRILKPVTGILMCKMTFYIKIPRYANTDALKTEIGDYCIKRPDLDNYIKFYLDCMNEIVYEDDAQIAHLLCKKVYSDKPRVNIKIYSLENNMTTEHAITIKNDVTLSDLEYLIKKANRIGKLDKDILRIFIESDEDGQHVYYDIASKNDFKVGKIACQ